MLSLFRSPDFEFQFSKFADIWLSERIKDYAPSVKRDVARSIELYKGHFGKTDIREIRKADITVFIDSLPEHFKAKTRQDLISRLHVIFKYAMDQEMIERVPGFPKIEAPETEVKWINQEWQHKILAEIPEKDRPIFVFMATWGARPAEARALMWDCVDFEKEIIAIKRTFSGCGTNHLQEHTKTQRIRYLPFTDELRDVFRKIRAGSAGLFLGMPGQAVHCGYQSDLERGPR